VSLEYSPPSEERSDLEEGRTKNGRSAKERTRGTTPQLKSLGSPRRERSRIDSWVRSGRAALEKNVYAINSLRNSLSESKLEGSVGRKERTVEEVTPEKSGSLEKSSREGGSSKGFPASYGP